MMQPRDWLSMLAGLIIMALGLLPLLHSYNIGWPWFGFVEQYISAGILVYIVAIAGFYLAINSVIEITNSSAIGWWSFIIAVVVMVVGVLKLLATFNMFSGLFSAVPFLTFSNIPRIVYHIIFIVEGLFLLIAGFAMEL